MAVIKNVEICFKNNRFATPAVDLNLSAMMPYTKFGWITLFILCIGVENVWAVGNDSLSTGVTTAETILTGSMMRLIVIAGSVFGVIKAYMASSPLLMGGSVAIGIGINLLMTWVKATWPILI